MAMSKNENEFTKLRIKKSTIGKLNKIKAYQEVGDGKRRAVYQLIEDWADSKVKEIVKNEKLKKVAPF